MDGNEKAQHHRDAFQIERVILFTDAVFAIAITLLVIEIKVPELEHPTESAVQSVLAHLIPKFVGFLLSFFIIAIYWMAHHRIFRFVRRLDNRLLWLNLVFLLSIVIMPFTTAYQSEYSLLRTPWIVYSINIAFTGLMQTALQRHLRNHRHQLVADPEHEHPDLDLARPLMSPLVFVSSIALAFVLPPIALRLIPAVAFPLLGFLNRRRYRRLDAAYRQKHGARVLA
ncbi:DUF1211 domain-containing protein [Hymenobacter aquaticus]|uniref:DUF1211 domain-containing protein n=1 Tax=Hymenobacter aquaticus TaxID=1867101 RepID=A0A4Z0PTE6_9BACT|nr:TMEM175 family protein [Hymenobacter aquaticus]TGE20576.1 DUF1211 domain-containing protein [Hymenobacter aquaticus]